MKGCTNPKAVNYNPAADEDDGTCLYLRNVEGDCHLFTEANPDDESFTISQSLLGEEWAFFHDYKPDFYINTRDQLYVVQQNKLYKANAGNPGQYGPSSGPFFIDLVLLPEKEQILGSIQWVSEVLNTAGVPQEHVTFTHVTVWNNYQCTGRIPLDQAFLKLQSQTHRKSRGVWSFNEIRDIVSTAGVSFLKSIFEDYRPIPAALNQNMPWYKKQLLSDDHFIVRLEYDNTTPNKIILHQVGAVMETGL